MSLPSSMPCAGGLISGTSGQPSWIDLGFTFNNSILPEAVRKLIKRAVAYGISCDLNRCGRGKSQLEELRREERDSGQNDQGNTGIQQPRKAKTNEIFCPLCKYHYIHVNA